ncbi:type VI secretion system baseplate subunit TssE [Taylorella equigenitalis]|uniref:Uncharacterized protein ImpF n=3 Tax=Taylorella equigenitalis TaxID=29575 RepID=A0A654KGZ4_TAYEM|nr:type VI secretion system baseplate subunit TssE [Taylorella equigenitalis]ADU91660.1 Uncharacterized protein ImpF [Taylorella equigenitalis MCE9]AFN35200.1 lysozyme-like protein [Taylorella equigenitalis ATCC 35865]ASY29896.1 hypothetical protein B9Z30_00480 [Taylorella equigenitalis]ASY37201.1 type VI secretion system baseplate subunit TssE [Taylorella equigenitalis]ASY38643.1 hypothetical protein CA604_00480 [Taylorella equigenitalis]
MITAHQKRKLDSISRKSDQDYKDKLQPVLLDKLTDEHPERRKELREAATVINFEQLKKSVLRDLGWLLNTVNLESIESLDGYNHVKSSTINFGVFPVAGQKMSEINHIEIQNQVRNAIINFEPRILPNDLEVICELEESDLEHYNVLSLIIKGRLWCNPHPMEFFLRTSVDLESGHMEIKDEGRGSL